MRGKRAETEILQFQFEKDKFNAQDNLCSDDYHDYEYVCAGASVRYTEIIRSDKYYR